MHVYLGTPAIACTAESHRTRRHHIRAVKGSPPDHLVLQFVNDLGVPFHGKAGGTAEDPRSAAAALSADIFGRELSAETAGALSRVSPAGNPSPAARVLGLTLASPEMQAR